MNAHNTALSRALKIDARFVRAPDPEIVRLGSVMRTHGTHGRDLADTEARLVELIGADTARKWCRVMSARPALTKEVAHV